MCSTEVAGFWSGKGNQPGGTIPEIESYNLLAIGSGEAGK